MSLDWIPSPIESGEATVYCKTCETEAEFDPATKVYECECEFGATIAALAMGLEGYRVTY